MGSKERLQKELDLLLEKIRFWRYVIFGIVSGTLGIIISASQNKLQMNLTIMIVLIIGFIGLIISIKRIESLTNDYNAKLELLEKEP
jgi:sulfite exporter TauE/SafE